MIDSNTTDKIREEFETSSWAIWSEQFPDEKSLEHQAKVGEDDVIVDLVRANLDMLAPSTILLGTNPSGGLPANFWNFHYPSSMGDGYLKSNIQEEGLEHVAGAYMTDLLKQETHTQKPPTRAPTEEEETAFRTELELLGQDEYNVICFGKSTFDTLISNWVESDLEPLEFPNDTPDGYQVNTTKFGKELTFYVIYHYSQGYHKINGQQLRHLNDQYLP